MARTKRSAKWQRRLANYITLDGPLTFPELKLTRKVARYTGSDDWLRRQLDKLEARGVISYDPATGTYSRACGTRADPDDD